MSKTADHLMDIYESPENYSFAYVSSSTPWSTARTIREAIRIWFSEFTYAIFTSGWEAPSWKHSKYLAKRAAVSSVFE